MIAEFCCHAGLCHVQQFSMPLPPEQLKVVEFDVGSSEIEIRARSDIN